MKKTLELTYPRWEFVTGGCGHGHRSEKSYGYYVDSELYLYDIRYDRSARNWVLDGNRRFAAGGADICRAIGGIKSMNKQSEKIYGTRDHGSIAHARSGPDSS
jgi:hypothetical protein